MSESLSLTNLPDFSIDNVSFGPRRTYHLDQFLHYDSMKIKYNNVRLIIPTPVDTYATGIYEVENGVSRYTIGIEIDEDLESMIMTLWDKCKTEIDSCILNPVTSRRGRKLLYCKLNLETSFYNEDDEIIQPQSLIRKRCRGQFAILFENIVISHNASIQVKLYEAVDVKPMSESLSFTKLPDFSIDNVSFGPRSSSTYDRVQIKYNDFQLIIQTPVDNSSTGIFNVGNGPRPRYRISLVIDEDLENMIIALWDKCKTEIDSCIRDPVYTTLSGRKFLECDLIISSENAIQTSFYDKYSEIIQPQSLIRKYCKGQFAILFDSIVIRRSHNIALIQVKLYKAVDVKPLHFNYTFARALESPPTPRSTPTPRSLPTTRSPPTHRSLPTTRSPPKRQTHPDGEDEEVEEGDPYCVACMVNKPKILSAKCGHLCLCVMCSRHIFENKKICPKCRGPWTDLVKVHVN